MSAKNRRLSVGLCSALVLALPCVAGAKGPDPKLDAQAIAEKVLQRNAFGFENARVRVRLFLTSKRGKVREREVEIHSLRKNNLGYTLARFHAPADVLGTTFLVREQPGDAEDEQYLFLPALGKTKRITGSQKNQRFMGTDLTYGDLESRSLKDGLLRRLADAEFGGVLAYVIESKPKDPKKSSYGKTITWIHPTTFVALKVEFYDRSMKPLKTMKVAEVRKRDDDWLVWDSSIENLQARTKTRMKVESLDTQTPLGESDFTVRAMEDGG